MRYLLCLVTVGCPVCGDSVLHVRNTGARDYSNTSNIPLLYQAYLVSVASENEQGRHTDRIHYGAEVFPSNPSVESLLPTERMDE